MKRLIGIIVYIALAGAGLATRAQAQEATMIRFYLLPIERNATGNARGPKYFAWRLDPDPPGLASRWSMKDYGSIDMCTLAVDITTTDHDALVLNADVYAFPENLDVTMTLANRQALNTYLEAHGLPGDWLAAGVTFRGALKTVTGMMLYMQRVLAIIGYPTDPYAGITLNTQYRNIPNPLHDALSQAASELGYAWNVANNDQVRKILKLMSDEWGVAPIYFGFVTL